MKQKIHYLFMLLLMLLTGVGGVKSQTTYKLEKVTKVEAGGLYVFEQSGYVMTTVSSKVLQITKTYKTTGLKGSENYVFTLESATASDKETQGFKMKNMSLSSDQYIGNKSSSTDMTATSVDAAAVWAFNFQDDQTVLIQNLNNNNRFLGFNNATTPTGYKAYAASNMSANPHDIVVYKLVEESSLPSAGLAFAEDSYTATLGESFTAPTLTNPHSLPVSYASSEETVATVDATTGAVTLVGAGTTTITASSEATAEYAAGSASYTLTVSKAPLEVNPKNVNSNYFVKVTDADELEDGDAILIVNEDAKKAMSTTQNNNNRAASDVTIGSDAIDAPAKDVQRLILVKEGDDYYYFNTGEDGYLYAASSTKNYLKTGTDCDDNYKAKISYAEGNATITFQGSNSRNVIKYNNAQSNGNLFSCYASTSEMQVVQIYKEVVKPVVAVEAPTFSVEEGTYYGPQTVELTCATDGAKIYYTLDGTEPTAESTEYTGAISISETTTLKAIAVKDEKVSSVASATYTFPATYASIADLKGAAPKEEAILTLTDAQVLYKGTDDLYIKDATGAIDFYKTGLTYTAGQILNGTIVVKYELYKTGLPEVTEVSHNNLTATEGTVAPVLKESVTLPADMCQLVQVCGNVTSETVTVNNKEQTNYYVDGLQIYDKFKLELGLNNLVNKFVIATGIVVPYNGNPEIALTAIEAPATQAYAVVEKNAEGKTAVSFYYDAKKSLRSGEGVKIVDELNCEKWIGETLTTATFDSSFKDYDGLTMLNGWFKDSPNLTTVSGLEYLNTENVTSMVSMFNGCESLKAPLDFSNFNTANVTDMSNMFYQCKALTVLDLSSFNTANVENMAHMFYGCTSLTELDLSTFNTAKVTDMTSMFASCSELTKIYVGDDWSIDNLSSIDNHMFNSSAKLVGGAGTKQDPYQVDADRAHVDGGAANPGYLSSKTAPAAPTFSVEAGTYTAEQTVTITAAEGATIYYTTDGTEPSAQKAEQKYTEPITISETTTLKAIAVKGAVSEVAEATYTIEIPVVTLSAPIIFHDGGEYEDALTVAMAGEGTIMYTLNDGEAQTYSAPFTIKEDATIKAWAVKDGAKSDEVEKTFTIVAKQAGAEVPDGYYNIMTNDGKYVNVAGRKTVTLVSDNEGKAGTVIRVKADAEGVKVLRSQGVDVPGYAKKAMNYVPEIVQLAVDKLHAEGSGEILGEHGLDAIMEEFNKSFDYNLYLEKSGEAYRIYGRTPSMKPVVDFYAKNKANVDAKLPQLEAFINSAIDKVLDKTGGRGASILVDFKLHDVWQKMSGTLTEPVDEASTMKFYEEVLTSETNVWNFAYQTAMIYWGNLKNHPRFPEIKDKLGDYAKYIDKVENIRPNFKYYIVPSGSGVDFISEGNEAITGNNASAAWTMEPVTTFQVELPTEKNVTVYPTSGGTQRTYKEYYTTLYTDFAYTLREGVKAYKVTAIDEKTGVAKREEITGTIPAQTPVLLVGVGESNTATLTLSTEAGTAITGNLLVGPDALINEYQIKTPQVVSLFDFAKEILGESAYKAYVEKYEHLMLKNAGTVNNKYFFGLTEDDLGDVTNLRILGMGYENELGFHDIWEKIDANKAFILTNDFDPVKLFLVGDVNRDGAVSIADVTALVNIILGKAKYPEDNDKYDFEAANVNGDKTISIADVTALVNIILGK